MWVVLGVGGTQATMGGSYRGWFWVVLNGSRVRGQSRVTVYKRVLRSNKSALELHTGSCVSHVPVPGWGTDSKGTDVVLLTGHGLQGG